MNKDLQTIRVFISSPNDVQKERIIVKQVAEELNRTIAPRLNLYIRLLTWEDNVIPCMGSPQEIINKSIGNYDVLIGIMWKRFGTAAGKYNSGTEEEFRNAYDRWKLNNTPQIMFYFSNIPYVIKSSDEVAQLKRVIQFREEIDTKGIINYFDSYDEFQGKIREHLTEVLFSYKEPDDKIRNILLLRLKLRLLTNNKVNKYEILRRIIYFIRNHLEDLDEQIIKTVLDREHSASTGAGYGVALPHCYGTSLPYHIILFTTSAVGIEWEAVDELPVHLISLMLYSNVDRKETLGLLTAVSRLLIRYRNDTFKQIELLELTSLVKSLSDELLGTSKKIKINISNMQDMPELEIND